MRTFFPFNYPLPGLPPWGKEHKQSLSPLRETGKGGLETICNHGFLIMINNNIFYLWHQCKMVNYAFTCDSLGCES